jgi:hypothetical protein
MFGFYFGAFLAALLSVTVSLGACVMVNLGPGILSNRMTGAGTEPKFVGWGTGAGTAVVANSTLFTEVALDGTGAGTRPTGVTSRVTTTQTNDTWKCVATCTATATLTITNAGLWDNATIGSGTLFIKADHSADGLVSGDSIVYTFSQQYIPG